MGDTVKEVATALERRQISQTNGAGIDVFFVEAHPGFFYRWLPLL
jgi:hypothetical protein